MAKPKVGKNAIESLTMGMYEDCRFIYREYIQNSADQIDKANKMSLYGGNESGQIFINIDTDKKYIEVEDNATGIKESEVYPILSNVACSTKVAGKEKGFRGIGRLGGLGYCQKMIFVTSCKGEEVKSTMVWDAVKLRKIIEDVNNTQEATEVIAEVTSVSTEFEEKDNHYFKVILEGVTKSDLLDVNKIKEYLEMVAPIEIQNNFIFRSKINDYMAEHNLKLDTYDIYVNGEQIYKPYTSKIYESNNNNKKAVDDILDVRFVQRNDDDGNLMYWGWYTLSNLKEQMKPINIARGIRLRKENIQIGDAEICKKFFTATNDQRFSFYFFGEIHVVSNRLIPNSRRDYFGENNDLLPYFESKVRDDFRQLKDICYESSETRKLLKDIQQVQKDEKDLETQQTKGFINTTQKETLEHKVEQSKVKADEAKKKLAQKLEKMKNSDSPFYKAAMEMTEKAIGNETNAPSITETPQKPVQIEPRKTKYRTDAPQYSRFDKKEKRLIGRVYEVLSNALPAGLSETVILKLEEELTK